MGFRRGTWRCHVKGCGEDAELALVVLVSSPGNRKERRQKASTSVRLCRADIKQLLKGKLQEPLLTEIAQAVKNVTGER
jgi:hypothetical protein